MGPSPWDPPPQRPIPLRGPRDVWAASKQIDELQGEWGYAVFVERAMNFHLAPTGTTLFYEPTADFDRIALEASLVDRAEGFRVKHAPNLTVTLDVFPSIYDADDGHLRLPSEGETTIGQHLYRVLGMSDPDTLVVASSWSGWTADHLGYIGRNYFDAHGREGMVSHHVSVGPLAATVEQLLTTDDPAEFRELWSAPRARGADHVSTEQIWLKWYETYSLQDESSAEVIILQSDGVRACAAVLVHRGPLSIISDLFTWPTYRRRGFATRIEEFAVERSIARGATSIAACVWNADCVVGRGRAESFLRSRDYAIEYFDGAQMEMGGRRAVLPLPSSERLAINKMPSP